jgi:hypothetical protein
MSYAGEDGRLRNNRKTATGESLDTHPLVTAGGENVQAASLLALRMALKLEVRGLKRSRRPSARQIANGLMKTNYRTADKTYREFDPWLVQHCPGTESSPLDTHPGST